MTNTNQNPKGSNVYNTRHKPKYSTPSGSHLISETWNYKHDNPMDCFSVNKLKEAVK